MLRGARWSGGAGTRDGDAEILCRFVEGTKFELCTDLDLALEAAGEPIRDCVGGGTGSAAIGRDGGGRGARSGGYGPKTSDEGSAFSVGRAPWRR